MTIVFLSHFDANLYLFRLPVMKALAKKGWRVIALCPEGEYSHRFPGEGIEHIAYKMDRGSLNPFKELQAIRAIAVALKKISPDILHTFTVKPNIYGNIAGRIAGVKHIISSVTGLGSFFIEQDIKSRLVRSLITLLYRIVFLRIDRVVFQNSDDLELFASKGIVSREKTVLIKGSGIDTRLWKRKGEDPHGREKRILFIGRLLIHKGVGEFIEAARIVKKKHPGAQFIIAGDFYRGNPYNIKRTLLEKAVEEGVVTFLGWREEIRELMEEADIFVLPSYREGMPRTAIEAASMSLPVITTDAVGCKEVVDDKENGFLVPVGESGPIAEHITTLLEDDLLYAKMARKGRKKAEEEFDAEVIVSEHLKLYRELLKEL